MGIIRDWYFFRKVFGRGQNNPFCFNFISNFYDFDRIANTDAGIKPGEIINTNLSLVPVFDKRPPDLGHGPAFPFNCHKIPRRDLEEQHCFGIEPGFSTTLISGVSGIYPQLNFRHYLKGHIRRDL